MELERRLEGLKEGFYPAGVTHIDTDGYPSEKEAICLIPSAGFLIEEQKACWGKTIHGQVLLIKDISQEKVSEIVRQNRAAAQEKATQGIDKDKVVESNKEAMQKVRQILNDKPKTPEVE